MSATSSPDSASPDSSSPDSSSPDSPSSDSSSSDSSSSEEYSEAFSKAEGGLKAAALDVTAQAGTFTVWPADHEGQEYLKIHFQFTQGGASYPVMMMAVAETSPSVGRLVGFARDRTCGEFTFTADDTYFTGAVHADKIYVYYVDAQRILKSVGIWKMQDIGDTGAKHADFAKVLRHNAGRLGLAVE